MAKTWAQMNQAEKNAHMSSSQGQREIAAKAANGGQYAAPKPPAPAPAAVARATAPVQAPNPVQRAVPTPPPAPSAGTPAPSFSNGAIQAPAPQPQQGTPAPTFSNGAIQPGQANPAPTAPPAAAQGPATYVAPNGQRLTQDQAVAQKVAQDRRLAEAMASGDPRGIAAARAAQSAWNAFTVSINQQAQARPGMPTPGATGQYGPGAGTPAPDLTGQVGGATPPGAPGTPAPEIAPEPVPETPPVPEEPVSADGGAGGVDAGGNYTQQPYTALPYDPQFDGMRNALALERSQREAKLGELRQGVESSAYEQLRQLLQQQPQEDQQMMERFAGNGMAYSGRQVQDRGALAQKFAEQQAQLLRQHEQSLNDMLRGNQDANDANGQGMEQAMRDMIRNLGSKAGGLGLGAPGATSGVAPTPRITADKPKVAQTPRITGTGGSAPAAPRPSAPRPTTTSKPVASKAATAAPKKTWSQMSEKEKAAYRKTPQYKKELAAKTKK